MAKQKYDNNNDEDHAKLTSEYLDEDYYQKNNYLKNQISPAGIPPAKLTPARLANILKNDNQLDYLRLASQMEETDAHYAAVLATRKHAVSSLEPVIEAASESEQDIKIAGEVRKMLDKIDFAALSEDMLDGLGKGYAVIEIIWQRTLEWVPQKMIWRDQRFFCQHNNQLFIRYPDNNKKPLPNYKFILHIPKLRSGPFTKGGLARLCSVLYMYKTYTLRDWMAFLEVFGMPVKIGKYGKNATDDDVRTLQRALHNLGADGAGVIPKEMEIEFIAAQNGRGQVTFGQFAEYIDKQISKAVLGQTMTTDEGSSLSQSKTHEAVRQDIMRADAMQMAYSINRDLIRPYVELNFGKLQNGYPKLKLTVTKKEDLKELAENLAKLVPLGLKINANEVRRKFGFAEPEKNSEILGNNMQNK